jgi:DNA helicase HerA-like ATPase
MRLRVVDLAGMEQYVAQYAVQKTWPRYGGVRHGKLPHPVFVVLEEAHNFVPASGRGAEAVRAMDKRAPRRAASSRFFWGHHAEARQD